MTIPIDCANRARLIEKFSNAAIKEPLQTPLPGIGIPTKIDSPTNSYFFIIVLFLSILFSNLIAYVEVK